MTDAELTPHAEGRKKFTPGHPSENWCRHLEGDDVVQFTDGWDQASTEWDIRKVNQQRAQVAIQFEDLLSHFERNPADAKRLSDALANTQSLTGT